MRKKIEESIKEMFDRVFKRVGIPDHIPDEQIDTYRLILKKKRIKKEVKYLESKSSKKEGIRERVTYRYNDH